MAHAQLTEEMFEDAKAAAARLAEALGPLPGPLAIYAVSLFITGVAANFGRTNRETRRILDGIHETAKSEWKNIFQNKATIAELYAPEEKTGDQTWNSAMAIAERMAKAAGDEPPAEMMMALSMLSAQGIKNISLTKDRSQQERDLFISAVDEALAFLWEKYAASGERLN